MEDLVQEDELFSMFQVERRKKLMGLLDEQGVRYFVTLKGKVFTTWTAINAGLIGRNEQKQEQPATFSGSLSSAGSVLPRVPRPRRR